jgi:transposase
MTRNEVDKMRKVDLSMKENNKHLTVKKLVETSGNKKRAATDLNCSVRHINRMIQGYKKSGKEFFIHGNCGRKPVHTLDDNTKQLIVDLYRTKYSDANITHYSELLEKHERIKVSPSTIRSTLLNEFILSPKAKHTTKKNLDKYLKSLKKDANSK